MSVFKLVDLELGRARAVACLKSMFVGDALSMPVHWFYNPADIARYFPGGRKNSEQKYPSGIWQMEDAPADHPSSIMSLHSTSAGGRGSQSKGQNVAREIVGEVILKGKRQFWGISRQHYHQGMKAGDNTLNACCARLLIRNLTQHKGIYHMNDWLKDYVEFMTADPPRHPDTYAESYHRGFFANLEKGNPPTQCGAVTHDTPSVGGLVTLLPLALAALLGQQHSIAGVQQLCRDHLFLTHPDNTLAAVSDALVVLAAGLLNRPAENTKGDNTDEAVLALLQDAGTCVKADVRSLLARAKQDSDVVGGRYSTACYITDSWPSLLYLAANHHGSVEEAAIANTNLGGENAHRGAVLAGIVGLITGETSVRLYGQLLHKAEIEEEVEAFVQACLDGEK